MALREVKETVSLPLDVLNKARLFEEQLEKEEKLSRGHIIRYLGDQARKMERTWGHMQLLVKTLLPEGLVQQGI